MIEIWKSIDWAPNYKISNLGQIKGPIKILKPSKNKKGYLLVDIRVFGKPRKIHLVHRLVAEVFIPNPNNLLEVDHIDNDITNNKADNLQWITQIENLSYKAQHLTIDNISLSIREWCEIQGINIYTYYTRIRRGKTPKQALNKE